MVRCNCGSGKGPSFPAHVIHPAPPRKAPPVHAAPVKIPPGPPIKQVKQSNPIRQVKPKNPVRQVKGCQCG